jgi:hypothetical protein
MSNDIPESWQIFMEQYPQFMKLQRKLATMDWYTNEGWVMFVGHFHAGIFMQLYKAHWFNYTLDGIHFETGLTTESLSTKKLGLDLHIGHRNLFDRVKFNEITIPRMAEVVATWDDDYRFSKKNLTNRLSIEVPFTKTGFAEQLIRAFTRFSPLGSIIDEGLAQL